MDAEVQKFNAKVKEIHLQLARLELKARKEFNPKVKEFSLKLNKLRPKLKSLALKSRC